MRLFFCVTLWLLLWMRLSTARVEWRGLRVIVRVWFFRLLPVSFALCLRRDEEGELRVFLRVFGRERALSRKKRTAFAAELQKKLLRLIRLERLEGTLMIGMADDAAGTALLCGFARTVLSLLAANRNGRVRFATEPVFGRDLFFSQGKCMLSLKSGKAVGIGIQALARRAKEGIRSWHIRSRRSCAPQWKT